MARAEWTHEALKDLDEIYRYIAHEAGRPAVAKKNVLELRNKCEKYARLMGDTNTLLGTDRSNLGDGIRSFAFKRWIVVFDQVPKTIRVLAVFDGRQQYDKLFANRKT